MANGSDHPAVPFRRRITSSPKRRVINLTEENQSLLNSFRSSAALTPQETATCTQSLFNLMTSSDASQFNELISRLGNGSDLPRMVSLLTSNTAPFLQTARNENGSNRMQELLGKTDDVDSLFLAAILRRFLNIMNDGDASRVALRGMRVFSQEKREAMEDHLLRDAVHLAFDPDGYIVLNEIIDGLALDPRSFFRDQLLNIVAVNAHRLSDHTFGSRVVQRVLRLNDLRSTRNVAVSIRGHCVYLSFTKYGSCVVEMLLDTEAVMVVGELLWGCNGERLALLARNEYGNFVVWKALRVTQEMNGRDLFWRLVNKLRPFVHRLRGVHGRIGAFLDSL